MTTADTVPAHISGEVIDGASTRKNSNRSIRDRMLRVDWNLAYLRITALTWSTDSREIGSSPDSTSANTWQRNASTDISTSREEEWDNVDINGGSALANLEAKDDEK